MGMLDELTERQLQVLDFVRAYVSEHGQAPTRAEIAAHCGFRSPNAAEEQLQRLHEKGLLELVPNIPRGIAPGARVNGGRSGRRWTMEDLVTVQARVAAASPASTSSVPKSVRPEWNYSLFEAFEFNLPWAPSVNSAYANATCGRVKTSKARQFGELVWCALLEQRVPANCIAHPLVITLSQHAPSDQGDPDNGIKIVLDTLKRFGVLADDNRKIIKRLVVEDAEREEGGRVRVRIEPYLQRATP